MKNKIRTSKKVAKLAGKKLRSKKTPKSVKRLAGTALVNRKKK